MIEINREQFEGKTFIVTGGSGFIGSHIVDQLLQFHAKVIVIDNHSNSGTENYVKGEWRVMHLGGDTATYNFNWLGKVDGIFHEASGLLLPSFEFPKSDAITTIVGMINILEYARKFNIKVVVASTGSIYGEMIRLPVDETHPQTPVSPYATAKKCMEEYCRLYHRIYNVNVIMLRYFNVYGERQKIGEALGVIPNFVKKALANEDITINGDGLQSRDFLNVKDIVRANMLAYLAPENRAGVAVNIGGMREEVTIKSLAQRIIELTGSKSKLVFNAAKLGDIRRAVADSSLASGVIGYEPQISLQQGLENYIQYFKSTVNKE